MRLSKSKFLAGLQCHKRLYLEVHCPELATPPDAWKRALFASGTAVGELARRRFPGGVLVETDYRHPSEALRRTAGLIRNSSVPAMFEAAFEFEGVFVRVDILERLPSAHAREAGTPDVSAEARRVAPADLSAEARRVTPADLSAEARRVIPADLSAEARRVIPADLSAEACRVTPADLSAEACRVTPADLSAEAREASEGGWRLIEVKSSTRPKEVHAADLAVQAHVLGGAGLNVEACLLMYVNTGYVYGAGLDQGLDLDLLFAVQDLTDEVERVRLRLPERLAELKTIVLGSRTPPIEPGRHCHTPYECPFWSHCTKDKPDRWIYHLPGGDQVVQHCVERGIHTIDEIPPAAALTVVQRRVKENVEWISPGLGDALQRVRYPVHHLDFETFMPAVPRFALTRPYQPIPTQWSNHIEGQDGHVRHDEYLCTDAKDPREELSRALLDSLGREGSICVYSGYERAILERLADALPPLTQELRALIARLWDLLSVIREHYYHPGFRGSYSIKSVLPALVPELGYTDLDIREGGTAAQEYERMVFREMDWVEKACIREKLLAYCERDTLAMLRIRRVLLEKVSRLHAPMP